MTGVAVAGGEFGFDRVRRSEDRVGVFGELVEIVGLVEVASK